MNKIIDPEPKTLRGGEDKVYDVLFFLVFYFINFLKMESYEIREISSNLNSLRKQYDAICDKNQRLENGIQSTRHKIEKFKQIELDLESEKTRLHDKRDNCDLVKTQTQQKQKKAMLDKATYIHMIKRMKHDKISY